MKKLVLLACLAFVCMTTNAQVVFNEAFDSNDHGWIEYASKTKKCLIKDGTMIMQTDDNQYLLTTCFAQYDPQQDFTIECNILSQKRDIIFGLVFDYIDDYNFRAVYVENDMVTYVRYVDNKLVGWRFNQIKELKSVKKTGINLKLQQSAQKLVVLVDDMQALELRYVDIRYVGVGLYAGGDQKLAFDSFIIKQ